MKHLVVLTGAGISADSGLKTFRDSDGLWMGHDVYDVASPHGWRKNPLLVLDFYNQRRREVANAIPNAAHQGLVELEEFFKVSIVTQNIDDLHERAGSTTVLHLHGEIFKMHGQNNMKELQEIKEDINLGDKAADGSQLRPAVVWFEEAVPKMNEAKKIMQTADIFVLIGTSLRVYPAAGLINFVDIDVPKYMIDKNIPYIDPDYNLIGINKAATEGINILKGLLIT